MMSNQQTLDNGLSSDCLSERKEQLLMLLRQIAPELISDNQVKFDQLKIMLGEDVLAPAEHYELIWAGKNDARREIQKTTSHTLLPSADNTGRASHMLIEGENLEVLRVLQKSYHGKVKMIYIDPPYNTGNDSFVYPDDYSETLDEYQRRTGEKNDAGYLNKQSLWKKNSKESGQYHSAWLSMMYPRLYLARNLLRDDGVIFISIDDNEVSNLRLLCDEVFGAESFVTSIFVEMSATQGMKVKAAKEGNIVKNGEYILVYSKNGAKNIGVTPLFDYRETYDTHYSKININNKPENLVDAYVNSDTKHATEYELLKKKHRKLGLDDLYRYSESFKEFVANNTERIFRFDKVTGFTLNDVEEGCITSVDRGSRSYYLFNNGETVNQLLMLSDSFGQCDDFDCSFGLRKIRGDWWKEFYKDMGNVSKEGNMKFANGKKPVRLIKQLVKFSTKENDLVLDFFSGSGTTAHAVIELNLEDSSSRQSISVQMPEVLDEGAEEFKEGYRTIADITRARIENVITKLKAEQPDKTKDLACSNFTLAPSNFKVWRSDLKSTEAIESQLEVFQQAENKSAGDESEHHAAMLTELLLKRGFGALGVSAISKAKVLSCGITVHQISMENDRKLWLCFEPYQEGLKEAIGEAKPAQVILLNSCFVDDSIQNKADEQLSNLKLELASLDISLLII